MSNEGGGDKPTKAEREAAAKPGCTCVLCAMYHGDQAPSAEDVVIASLQREVADLKADAAVLEHHRDCARRRGDRAEEREEFLGDVLCAIGFDLARGPTKMVDDGLDFGGMVNLQLVIFGDGLAKRQRALEHVTAIMSGLAEVMVVEELVDESVPRLQRRAARRAGQGGS